MLVFFLILLCATLCSCQVACGNIRLRGQVYLVIKKAGWKKMMVVLVVVLGCLSAGWARRFLLVCNKQLVVLIPRAVTTTLAVCCPDDTANNKLWKQEVLLINCGHNVADVFLFSLMAPDELLLPRRRSRKKAKNPELPVRCNSTTGPPYVHTSCIAV